MIEQELVTSMQALTADARAVLANLVPFAEQNTDVTFALSNGQTVVVASLPKQIAAYAAQQAADRLAFLQNFGGLPSAQTVSRDTANRLTGTTTTFASGYQTVQTLARNPVTGQVTGMTIVCKDALGATLATITKTIVRLNGFYAGVI